MASENLDDWVRPRPTAAQRRADVWTGLAVAAVAVVNLFLARRSGFYELPNRAALAEQICWVLATTLPLVARRSHPDVVAVLISIAFIGGQFRGSQEQQVTTGVLFAAIVGMFGWLTLSFVIFSRELGDPAERASLAFNALVVNTVFFAFCHLMGDAVWNGARQRHELEEQAAELREAQTLVAERAVLGERVRIARELHDVVAHHVSVMGIQASAARRAMDKDPARSRTALAAVEEGARTAVDELRRMLGALRSPAAGTPAEDVVPNAGIDRLPEITDRARDAGLTVRYAVYGDPVPLPESLSQAVYRIAQEAVTNTLKHAHAKALDVRVRYLSGELELDVTDDGRGGSTSGGGLGLLGMRERVAVHDGALEHGPHPDGGYRVRARLPYQAGVVL
jgi:signal transduction histidine kinase